MKELMQPLDAPLSVGMDKVMELEGMLRDLPQTELNVTHHFAPHVYARVLYMPAGTMLTGKIHRHELMNILVTGTMRFVCDGEMQEREGFEIFNSGVGSKKAIYAVTDCILLNIHPTDLTDLAEIEAEFIAPDIGALEVQE